MERSSCSALFPLFHKIRDCRLPNRSRSPCRMQNRMPLLLQSCQ